MSWPQQADHARNAERLGQAHRAAAFNGVVVVTGPRTTATPRSSCRTRGRVRPPPGAHRPRTARHPGRAAAALRRDPQRPDACWPTTAPNLEQAGLRGLLRVIGAEHPHLRPTQIDVDERPMPSSWRANCCWRLRRRRDRLAQRRVVHRASVPRPLRPDERRTTVVDHQRDGMRLQIRTPGDLETLEFAAFDRIPPGPGRSRSRSPRPASTSPTSYSPSAATRASRALPQLGIDFAGVVTAVGPGVTDHRVGDHVGGMSPNGCWGTFVTCDADLAVTLPSGLSDGQAAAVTTAPATAWYGLHDLARIAAGDKVLIHSAHRRRGAGRDRDRPRRRRRDLRHRRQPRSAGKCCATWVSSMSTTHAAPSSPSRSAATPTATASTSCSTR